ncbi:Major facilitator superfamily domain, general substrate transporter, partial [Metarhizium majus ARSEF 297]
MTIPRVWDMITRRGKRPWLLEARSSVTFMLLMVATAVFTDIFPYAVIVPVLPYALEKRAGVRKSKVQFWISVSLTAFGIAVFISAPVWGILADRTKNRRTPMLVGLAILTAATFLLCFMKNVAMLMLGRMLQGMTSALTWSVGLALVVDTVPTERIGWAMGWVGIALALGTLSSPLLGGVVFEKGGWYEVWVMCFALVGVDVAFRLLVIEKKNAAKWLQQAETMQSEITHVPSRSTSSKADDAEETLQSQPYDDENLCGEKQPGQLTVKEMFGLFTSPRLLAALWGTVAEAAVLAAFDSTLPIFVQTTFRWNSVGAGLIFLPLVFPTCLGPVVGHLCDRYGPRWLSAFGFMTYTPFLVCLRFVTDNTTAHKVMLCGLLAGVGIGVAFTFGPVTAEITYAIEGRYKDQGAKPIALGYALYNIAFSAGVMIGPLLGGFVNENADLGTVGWSLAIISAITSVLCATFIGGPPLWKKMNHRATEEDTLS